MAIVSMEGYSGAVYESEVVECGDPQDAAKTLERKACRMADCGRRLHTASIINLGFDSDGLPRWAAFLVYEDPKQLQEKLEEN
jgi:hypothetical protein